MEILMVTKVAIPILLFVLGVIVGLVAFIAKRFQRNLERMHERMDDIVDKVSTSHAKMMKSQQDFQNLMMKDFVSAESFNRYITSMEVMFKLITDKANEGK